MPVPNPNCRCPKVTHQHGTHQCYRSCGCREQECREAHAATKRHATRQKAYGRSETHQVPAGPARKGIKRLILKGWSTEAIAKDAGVSESVINRIHYGINGVLQPTVRADSAAKILALKPGRKKRAKYEGTSIELTDSTGSKRRIQALVTQGFSLNALSQHAGYGRSYFKDMLSYEGNITLARVKTVSDLYDRLWDKTPVAETKAQRLSVTLAKKTARDNGWLPPMAWDDDLIDNPKHFPQVSAIRAA